MKKEKDFFVILRSYTKLNYIVFILVFTLLQSCSTTPPQKYFFECRKQSSEIIQKNIPAVLFNMGYHVTMFDTLQKKFIAEKIINSSNTKNGRIFELIQMQIVYKTDTLSEITTYFVNENNSKRKSTALSPEQIKKYEPEFLMFVEKMGYYCDERFKGFDAR